MIRVAHGAADAAQLTWLMASGGLLITGASSQTHLSELQVIAVASGAGLAGGFVHALLDNVDWHWREYGKRILASGMVAPAVVLGLLVWGLKLETFTLLPVVAAAGPAGIVSYPIAQLLPKLAPRALRDWFERNFGGTKS